MYFLLIKGKSATLLLVIVFYIEILKHAIVINLQLYTIIITEISYLCNIRQQ